MAECFKVQSTIKVVDISIHSSCTVDVYTCGGGIKGVKKKYTTKNA